MKNRPCPQFQHFNLIQIAAVKKVIGAMNALDKPEYLSALEMSIHKFARPGVIIVEK